MNELLSIIQNSLYGEDVRNAIVAAFRMLDGNGQANVPFATPIEYDDYLALSEEEKMNGMFYFISDIDIEDGDDVYFGSA